jgi:anthranilate phosphoribosyltransferase
MLEHPFAQFIRILGKGKTGSRSLSFTEAHQAFLMILQQQASPEQVGAFLMLLRVKEESAEEIAGFVKACKDFIDAPSFVKVDIDWSSYAGKRKQLPWFILCLVLLAENGRRVLIHGAKGHTDGRLYTEDAFKQLQLPIAANWDEAESQLQQQHLCYMPIEAFCEPLYRLINLRSLFGLRSPVHTLCRLINPCNADFSFSSIFHPAYAGTHQQAAQLLRQKNMLVFKGESGEIERKADATCLVKSLQSDHCIEEKWPRLQDAKQELSEAMNVQKLTQLWRGNGAGDAESRYGEQAVIGTLAICLKLIENIGSMDAAQERAATLWQQRNRNNTLFTKKR